LENLYHYSNIIVDASFLFQEREPTDGFADGMDQSRSDADDDSDSDDRSIMFDIPEEHIMISGGLDDS